MSAALVLGGVDITGPHLYNIYPHGSSDKLPYLTMGSGSLAAMSVRAGRRLGFGPSIGAATVERGLDGAERSG